MPKTALSKISSIGFRLFLNILLCIKANNESTNNKVKEARSKYRL